jgi:PKHD-type hydroxylase
MDIAIQHLSRKIEQDDQAILSLTGVYHNLLRQWAEV